MNDLTMVVVRRRTVAFQLRYWIQLALVLVAITTNAVEGGSTSPIRSAPRSLAAPAADVNNNTPNGRRFFQRHRQLLVPYRGGGGGGSRISARARLVPNKKVGKTEKSSSSSPLKLFTGAIKEAKNKATSNTRTLHEEEEDDDDNAISSIVGAMDGMDNGVNIAFDSIQLLRQNRKRAKQQQADSGDSGSSNNIVAETLLDGSIRGHASSGRVLAIWPCSSQYCSPPMEDAATTTLPTTKNSRNKQKEQQRTKLNASCRTESKSARLLLEALAGNRIPADPALELQGNRIVNGGLYEMPGNATLPSTVIVGGGGGLHENWNPYLTVRETLDAYVQLVLSSQQPRPLFTKQARDAHVDELLAQVGLTSRQDALVGIRPSSSLSSKLFKNKNKENKKQLQEGDSGISNVERRLLFLAVSMIGNPKVLLIQPDFLEMENEDDIIDLYSTIPRLLETLQRLATRHHKTIVTVLPPTMPSRLFDTFVFPRVNDLLLLSEGRMFYSGPIADLPTYFMQLGYKIPTSFHQHAAPTLSSSVETGAETAPTSSSRRVKTANMAEHIKQCLSKRPRRINHPGQDEETEQQAQQRVELLAATASSSTMYNSHDVVNKWSSVVATNGPLSTVSSSSSSSVSNNNKNLWLQLRLHLYRSLQSLKRRRMDILFQFIQHVGFALLYSYGVPPVGRNQASIQDRMTIFSKIAVRTASVAFVSGLRGIPKKNRAREQTLVSVEINQGMYSSPLPYCMARTVADLSLSFLWNAIYGSVVYTQTGLDMAAPAKPYKFLALLASHGMACDAMGSALSTILLPRKLSDNSLAMLTVAGLFNFYFHLDGRRLLKDMTDVQDNNEYATSSMMSSSLPFNADQWIPNFSPTKWGLESLLLNEFSGLEFEPDGDMFDVDGLPQFDLDFENFGNICYTGEDVLERLRLSPDDSDNDVDGSLDFMIASSSPLGLSISSMMKSLTNVLFPKKPISTTTTMKDVLRRQYLVTSLCWTFSYVQLLASCPFSSKNCGKFLSMQTPQEAAENDRDEPDQEQTGFRWF